MISRTAMVVAWLESANFTLQRGYQRRWRGKEAGVRREAL